MSKQKKTDTNSIAFSEYFKANKKEDDERKIVDFVILINSKNVTLPRNMIFGLHVTKIHIFLLFDFCSWCYRASFHRIMYQKLFPRFLFASTKYFVMITRQIQYRIHCVCIQINSCTLNSCESSFRHSKTLIKKAN